MNKQTMTLGVVVVALAGGVMYCADAFDDTGETETVRYDDETNRPNAEPDDEDSTAPPAAIVDWTYLGGDAAKPAFYAVKSGDGPWRHPDPEGEHIRFDLHDEQGRYTIALVCETEGLKGKRNVHTVMLEGTWRELEKPRVTCPAPSADRRTVQLAGAVRRTGGEDVDVAIGTQRVHVTNEKQADDVLFSMDVAEGPNAVVVSQGSGAKTRYAVARDARFDGDTGQIEIDMQDAKQTSPVQIPIAGDGYSYLAGGQAHLWYGGLTRTSVGPVESELVDGTRGLRVRTSTNPRDILDLRLDFRNKIPFWGVEPAPVAHVRFVGAANAIDELILPELSFTEESLVRVDNDAIEVAWKVTNWAAFGYASDDDFALFAPTAYVARFSQEDANARRHLDLIVTPMRARGNNPTYTFENPANTAGFEDRYLFRPADDVTVKAGNLTAYGHGEHSSARDAIAAYLDADAQTGPADYMEGRSLTTVVAGNGTKVVDASVDFEKYFAEECMQASTCIDRVNKNATHIQDCADLELYRRCAETDVSADPEQFVDDLKMEILRWYLFDEERMEDGPTMLRIMKRISAENVRQVRPDEPGVEYYPYDPRVYQVYYHPDPVHEDTAVLWYGAYLMGRLISIYPVNYHRIDN